MAARSCINRYGSDLAESEMSNNDSLMREFQEFEAHIYSGSYTQVPETNGSRSSNHTPWQASVKPQPPIVDGVHNRLDAYEPSVKATPPIPTMQVFSPRNQLYSVPDPFRSSLSNVQNLPSNKGPHGSTPFMHQSNPVLSRASYTSEVQTKRDSALHKWLGDASSENCIHSKTNDSNVDDDPLEDLEQVNPHPVMEHAQEDPIETHDRVVAQMELGGALWAPGQTVEPSSSTSSMKRPTVSQLRWHCAEIEEDQALSSGSNHPSDTRQPPISQLTSIDGNARIVSHGPVEMTVSVTGSDKVSPANSSLNENVPQKSLGPDNTYGNAPQPSGDVVNINSPKSNTERTQSELKVKLDQEVSMRKQQDDYIRQLQTYYDNLLAKHAIAEVTIDQLRMGVRVRAESEDRGPPITGGGCTTEPRRVSMYTSDRALHCRSHPLNASARSGSVGQFPTVATPRDANQISSQYASTPFLRYEDAHPDRGDMRGMTNNKSLHDKMLGSSNAMNIPTSSTISERGRSRRESRECFTPHNSARLNESHVRPSSGNSVNNIRNRHLLGDRQNTTNITSAAYRQNGRQESYDSNFCESLDAVGPVVPDTHDGGCYPDAGSRSNGLSIHAVETDLSHHVSRLYHKLASLRQRLTEQNCMPTDAEVDTMRSEYVQLKKCYHLAKKYGDTHMQEQGLEFDQNHQLDTELFQLGLQLEDLEACTQLSDSTGSYPPYERGMADRGYSNDQPAVLVGQSPDSYASPNSLSQFLPDSQTPVHLATMPSGTEKRSSSTCSSASGRENLRVLENLYVYLINQYNSMKHAELTAIQARKIQDLMKHLFEVASCVNGHSSLIPTTDELEHMFQLDGDTRQLSEELERVLLHEKDANASGLSGSAFRAQNMSEKGNRLGSNREHSALVTTARLASSSPMTTGNAVRGVVASNGLALGETGLTNSRVPLAEASISTQDSGLCTSPTPTTTVELKHHCHHHQTQQLHQQSVSFNPNQVHNLADDVKRQTAAFQLRSDSESSPTIHSAPTYSNLGNNDNNPSEGGAMWYRNNSARYTTNLGRQSSRLAEHLPSSRPHSVKRMERSVGTMCDSGCMLSPKERFSPQFKVPMTTHRSKCTQTLLPPDSYVPQTVAAFPVQFETSTMRPHRRRNPTATSPAVIPQRADTTFQISSSDSSSSSAHETTSDHTDPSIICETNPPDSESDSAHHSPHQASTPRQPSTKKQHQHRKMHRSTADLYTTHHSQTPSTIHPMNPPATTHPRPMWRRHDRRPFSRRFFVSPSPNYANTEAHLCSGGSMPHSLDLASSSYRPHGEPRRPSTRCYMAVDQSVGDSVTTTQCFACSSNDFHSGYTVSRSRNIHHPPQSCGACGGSGQLLPPPVASSSRTRYPIMAPLTTQGSTAFTPISRRVLSSVRSIISTGPLRAVHTPPQMARKRPRLTDCLAEHEVPGYPVREYSAWGGHRYHIREYEFGDLTQSLAYPSTTTHT